MSKNNISERNLIFFAGPFIGLGHFLTSVSIYKHYAFEHGRKFHIVCKNWHMAIDSTLDIDPLFSFMDQEAISQVNVSYRSVMSLLAASKQQQLTTLVTAAPDVLNSNSAEQFVFMHESVHLPGQSVVEWMKIGTFRKNHLNASYDHHADNILIFNAPAVHDRGMDYKRYDQHNCFAPFSGNFGVTDAVNLDESIGLHIRHGNGEYLHNRVEGGSREFESLLSNIVDKAKELSDKYGFPVIAFSDNSALLEDLKAQHGFKIMSTNNIPDRPFQEYFGLNSSSAHKYRAMEAALRDVYGLSRCAHVVCGHSLFTLAAYLYSTNKSFYKIDSLKTHRKTHRLSVYWSILCNSMNRK